MHKLIFSLCPAVFCCDSPFPGHSLVCWTLFAWLWDAKWTLAEAERWALRYPVLPLIPAGLFLSWGCLAFSGDIENTVGAGGGWREEFAHRGGEQSRAPLLFRLDKFQRWRVRLKNLLDSGSHAVGLHLPKHLCSTQNHRESWVSDVVGCLLYDFPPPWIQPPNATKQCSLSPWEVSLLPNNPMHAPGLKRNLKLKSCRSAFASWTLTVTVSAPQGHCLPNTSSVMQGKQDGLLAQKKRKSVAFPPPEGGACGWIDEVGNESNFYVFAPCIIFTLKLFFLLWLNSKISK